MLNLENVRKSKKCKAEINQNAVFPLKEKPVDNHIITRHLNGKENKICVFPFHECTTTTILMNFGV